MPASTEAQSQPDQIRARLESSAASIASVQALRFSQTFTMGMSLGRPTSGLRDGSPFGMSFQVDISGEFQAPDRARLFDFGLARRTSETRAARGFAGTAEYTSPEQCEERAELDARADLYAIGVMLFEMLTGRPPFIGAPNDVRQSHAGLRPPRPSSFAPVPAIEADVIGVGDYGGRFVSMVEREPFYGVQFHPEKSSAAGPQLLANFNAVCSRVAA